MICRLIVWCPGMCSDSWRWVYLRRWQNSRCQPLWMADHRPQSIQPTASQIPLGWTGIPDNSLGSLKTEPEGQGHTCAHWTCLLNASASLFIAFSSSTSQVFAASGSIILWPAATSISSAVGGAIIEDCIQAIHVLHMHLEITNKFYAKTFSMKVSAGYKTKLAYHLEKNSFSLWWWECQTRIGIDGT